MWGAPHDWNERCAICASGSTHSHGWWTNSHLLYCNVHQPECVDQPVGVHLAVTVAIIILLTLAVTFDLTVAVEFSVAVGLGVTLRLCVALDGTTKHHHPCAREHRLSDSHPREYRITG